MARSDKSKNNPLREKTKTRRSDEETSAPAESSEQAVSGDPVQFQSLPPAAGGKTREGRSQTQPEPSVGLPEAEQFLEQTPSISNGYQDGEDDPAAHRRIAEGAFMVFHERGCEHGNDWAHWFEAERRIRESRV